MEAQNNKIEKILDMSLNKDKLHFLFINNINTSNKCFIQFGKIKSNHIFDLKIKNNSNFYKYDIIPLINSMLSNSNSIKTNLLKFFDVKKYYFENKEHIIKKEIKNMQEPHNINDIYEYTFTNKLNNYYLIDNTIDKCIIFNTKKYIKNIYFPSLKEYNHKETFKLIEWVISDEIKINCKLYSNYITIFININLIESNKLPKTKVELITKLCGDLQLIIDFININNSD